MPNSLRLDLLRQLREDAGLTQAEMARLCGLRGRQSHQTAGAWERGEYAPDSRRRAALIAYLWDSLGLRRTPARFAEVWAMLEAEWGWAPIDDDEWRRFSQAPRPALAPPAPAITPPPFQAPAGTAHFVGRSVLIEEVRARLTTGAAPRLVALTGMGGIGKTALAVHLAYLLADDFPDGVLWAYSAMSDPRDVAISWAQAYGYEFGGLADLHSMAAALRGVLAPKRVLLVLDDVVTAARVQPLLPGSDNAAVLLTTRSADVAAVLGAAVAPVGELEVDEGLALLARLLGPARVAAEAEAARAICRTVQGLPLAVEIVGQLLAIRTQRPLAAMAERLAAAEQRLELQISDRAVRTSFAVSWDALDAEHRRLFACMGVFTGRAFGAAALAAVAALDLSTTQERLDTLAARSLVGAEAAHRFRQHPLLADFAREQLGEAPEPWLRMARYFGAYAATHAQKLAEVHVEWENLAAGMQLAYDRQEWRLVVDYGDALSEAWFAGAYYTEARSGCLRQCEAAAALGDGAAEARGYLRWGRACLEQDEYGEAKRLLEMAAAQFRALEDEVGAAEAHGWLARMAIEQANYPGAQAHLAACRALYASVKDMRGLASTRYQEAVIAYDSGNYALAAAHCTEVLAAQEQHDPRGQVATLRLLADVAIELEDYAEAAQCAARALALCHALSDRGELAAVTYSMATIARFRQDVSAALAHAEQAVQLARQTGMRGFEGLALYEQSQAYLLDGKSEQARILGEASLAILKSIEETFNIVVVLRHMGYVAQAMGQPGTAAAYWQAGLELASKHQHPLAEQLRNLIDHWCAFP